MYARAVEDAAARLRELRREEWEDLALAAVVLALAVAATEVLPAIALPLFLGGLVVAARGIRALWYHWDLVEQLAAEQDAYVIPAVLARAERDATMERRKQHASVIRVWLDAHEGRLAARVAYARADLIALAAELEDTRLALDPASAVACGRLLFDGLDSPLLNDSLTPQELRSQVRRIRSGFSVRSLAA